MSEYASRRTHIMLWALLVLLGVFGLSALVTGTRLGSDSAEAIPPQQARCAFAFIQTNSANPHQPISGLAVTVNNGAQARTAIVQLSADTGVDTGAEVRVAYSVDGGPPQEDVFGPANLANHQEFFEARTVIAVIPLPAGTHTITPHWRVSGVAGKQAFMDSRCMTVESRTR